ncbi:MAG: methylglyoxal synthase [Flavobacteriaceae bacterium]|nr:methylglyoxal synthase [Flavobacteriaceae bacterium]
MEIAIIAHDAKKNAIIEFLNENQAFFKHKKVQLIATGTTGSKIKSAGYQVEALLSGPLGGDAQIASRVAEGNCKLVIFFRDPLEKHPHEPDVLMLLRLCDVHNVPLATNKATASLLIKSFIEEN